MTKKLVTFTIKLSKRHIHCNNGKFNELRQAKMPVMFAVSHTSHRYNQSV